MKSIYLLPNKFKPLGWFLLVLGLALGTYVLVSGYDSELFVLPVFSMYSSTILGDGSQYFKLIENSVLDELACILIIIGGLSVAFTREKIEDEYIAKLRMDSMIWALVVNYGILLSAILFVYDFGFFDVLVFNMFTPLLFFVLRFNFLKSTS